MGEYVGKVKEIRGNSFNVAGTATFANGDGLCFINESNELEGFRINKAEGNRLFPLNMPRGLKRGTALYRNSDHAFEKEMNSDKTKRKLPVTLALSYAEGHLLLEAGIKDQQCKVAASREITLDTAKNPQMENIKKQLSKLGNTEFAVDGISLQPTEFPWFVPNSLLSDMRRECVEQLENRNTSTPRTKSADKNRTAPAGHYSMYPMPYMYNIANRLAEEFYKEEGLKTIRPAFELQKPQSPLIMQCRYCLRYEIGQCKKRSNPDTLQKDPLRIRLGDGRTFRLEFNCSHCMMNIYAEE